MIDATHDPALTSWVEVPAGHDFPIQNLPLGIADFGDGPPRAATAIGDWVVDLAGIADAGLIDAGLKPLVAAPALNALLADTAARRRLRAAASAVLGDAALRPAVVPHLYRAGATTLHLPCAIGDYTDFYVGIHHATNIGRLFRPDNPLLPNYKYVPIGYHGRASTVRPSGAPVRRPRGQVKAADAAVPEYRPTARLDFELEVAVWLGGGNELGQPIDIADAGTHIAGLGLLNDWSARDLQAWEYVPLGPFLAKSFLTTVSPWIVTAEALEPFRIAQPPRPDGDPKPLDYLWDSHDQSAGAFAVELFVDLTTAAMRARGEPPSRISRSAMRHMYWTAAQMICHHSSNGCALNTGDLLGTGTLSGPDDASLGSLIEMSGGGSALLTLPNGETRAFLRDGDEVVLTARAHADGFVPIGFGSCSGLITAA